MFTESVLTLDPRQPDVSALLEDARRMHRLVMAGFPASVEPAPRAAMHVLYRLDGRTGGLVEATVRATVTPHWDHLPAGVTADRAQTGELAAGAGDLLAVTCDANATKDQAMPRGPDSARKRGARVGLTQPGDLRDGFIRKGMQNGFVVQELDAVPLGARRGSRGLALWIVRFAATVLVVDRAAFAAAWVQGIGRGRAFGSGMLTFDTTAADTQRAG
jgi:hypothetical protein